MPRLSQRMKLIRSITTALGELVPVYLSALDDHDDELAEHLFLVVVTIVILCIHVANTRYSVPRVTYRRRQHNLFSRDLQILSPLPQSTLPFLNSSEFVEKYRMRCGSFTSLVDLVKHHPVFRHGCRGPLQESVPHQIMVYLRFFGSIGGGASNSTLRNLFRIGKGTNSIYIKRVRDSILSLEKTHLRWPNPNERIEIARRIEAKYAFPNCVGFIDGTLHALSQVPQREDAPDYSGRKVRFSLSTLIVCDDKRQIRYLLAGWPGTAHDNRIFKASNLYKQSAEFFGPTEYILGDSAYECTPFQVSAFRKTATTDLQHDQSVFNTALARGRILSEHTIGIWKARFPYLKVIPNIIFEGKESSTEIVKNIKALAILHNFLIEQKDNVREEWMEQVETSAENGINVNANGDGLSPTDELHQPVQGLPPHTRRVQLSNYINEIL